MTVWQCVKVEHNNRKGKCKRRRAEAVLNVNFVGFLFHVGFKFRFINLLSRFCEKKNQKLQFEKQQEDFSF